MFGILHDFAPGLAAWDSDGFPVGCHSEGWRGHGTFRASVNCLLASELCRSCEIVYCRGSLSHPLPLRNTLFSIWLFSSRERVNTASTWFPMVKLKLKSCISRQFTGTHSPSVPLANRHQMVASRVMGRHQIPVPLSTDTGSRRFSSVGHNW